MRSIAYHQNEVLYISKPQEYARWRVMRYSPKGADDIHDCVVMICQAYGNPQSSSSSLRGTPTAAWIKKFDKSKLVEFFGAPCRIRTCDLPVRSRALYPLS